MDLTQWTKRVGVVLNKSMGKPSPGERRIGVTIKDLYCIGRGNYSCVR